MELGLVCLSLVLAGPGAVPPPPTGGPEPSPLLDTLTPQPRSMGLAEGQFAVRGKSVRVAVPAGAEYEACRIVLREALEALGAEVIEATETKPCYFTIADGALPPPLGREGPDPDAAYVLRAGPDGISAGAGAPQGLLYAAQTLRQIARASAEAGAIPCLTIVDRPATRWRGIYIEGGQERFGRIVDPDYLCEQIRQLSALKMNALVIECYNLFPYASFPACADEGTLSPEDARRVVAESKRWHVTLIPSLQTLAQAYELAWQCDEGIPYREATAPGLLCPSTPEVYPFIKGLYRDLLTLFDEAPILGIGCSEIDMQWQGRYCPKCEERVASGETVRDLLLGHAEKCIGLVHELSEELGRPVRPMVWGDEFYMYGAGRDWVGLERIPHDTIMGFWKYWPHYPGISGLMERGYDVFGVSAMYNHCFYLADLSPADPPKSWPSMEQTGVTNITGLARAGQAAAEAYPNRAFLGAVAASFSKHRLRAFDSIWYGFALNGEWCWSGPVHSLEERQATFTRAFVRQTYDCRTEHATEGLALAYERLDGLKSRLERSNQTLHDVVGVYDTQEAGYSDNSLAGAFQQVAKLTGPDGAPTGALVEIVDDARTVEREARAIASEIDAVRPEVGGTRELGELWLAAEKIGAHGERQLLMADTQAALARARAAGGPLPATDRVALGARWSEHRQRTEEIERRTAPLYSRGDPCGLQAVLADIRSIEEWLAEAPAALTGETLLEEPFRLLDPATWLVRGEPRLVEGGMETLAPGGWENYSGITTQRALALEDERPLVVEFDLTPLKTGGDSQLFGPGEPNGQLAYRFCLYCAGGRFGVHTQSADALSGWASNEPGWQRRATGPAVTPGTTYRVEARITRGTFRVLLREAGAPADSFPFWDTRAIPMDALDEVRLLFSDVEPTGSTASTRWGPIRVWQAERM